MNSQVPIKVFIGNEPGNEKAEKALHWSIINTSTAPTEIYWMTDIYPGSVWSGWNKGRNHRRQESGEGWKTNFSAFRWCVPELCGFKGKGIYLEVDEIVTKDIKQMWELPMNEKMVLAITDERTDVMLMDSEKFNVNWWPKIEKMKPSGRNQKGYRVMVQNKNGIGRLDPIYNCMDGKGYDQDTTRLVHYTKMSTQPWHPFPQNMEYKKHEHPVVNELWHDYYAQSLKFEKDNSVVLGAPRGLDDPPQTIGLVTNQVAKLPTQ
jgi:lipopolysaccharide biosynthesis glycosyltransferase